MRIAGRDGRGEHDGEGAWTRLRENATGIASILVLGLWLVGLFTDQSWWLAVLVVGYVVVVPMVALIVGDEANQRGWWTDWMPHSSTDDTTVTDRRETSIDVQTSRDALEMLRERYAAGELTDDQFERKLERLLETETLEDARDQVRRRRGGQRDRDRNGDRGEGQDLEYEP